MMFGVWLYFDAIIKFLSKNGQIYKIFKKKQRFSKRVAKLGFSLPEKKVISDKYLLIIGEAQAMFGKRETSRPFSELNFWRQWESKALFSLNRASTEPLTSTKNGIGQLLVANPV